MAGLASEPLSHALSSVASIDTDHAIASTVHHIAAAGRQAACQPQADAQASSNAPAGAAEHELGSTSKPGVFLSGSEVGRDTYPSRAARQALFYAAKEQVEEVEAVGHGSIPPWLTGSLIMNGGGDYTAMRHLFDGYGLLSKVRLAGGRAWGSQRYLDTQAHRLYKQQGHVVIAEFATPPATLTAYLQQFLAPVGALLFSSINPMTDNASVSLYSVGPAAAADTIQQRSSSSSRKASTTGRNGLELLAITEDQWGSYLVDPATLKTIKQVRYPDRLPCIMQSPHPAVMSDGSLLNFSRTFPFGGTHLYRQDRQTLQRKEIAYIPDRHWLQPAWMHDFASTDRHAVLIEQPLYLDFLAQIGGWDNNAACMQWRPQEGARVHLVTLDGSKPVQTFTTPAFCCIHTSNAFASADGSVLHVDLAVFDSGNILNDLKMQSLREGPEQGRQVTRCQYMRLDVPLDIGGTLHLPGPRPLISDPAAKHVDFVDFPTQHPGLKGRPYRYAYATCAVRPTNIGNGLAKLDLATQGVKVWHEPGGVTGEPHFVPAPGAETAADVTADPSREDDGVVLSQCVDAQGRAFLLVLDAASWTELGRAVLPYSTPYRFHGVWLPSSPVANGANGP